MCAVNEGVHPFHHRERSEGDVKCTTGVNSVQGRCRVTDIGWRPEVNQNEICRIQQTGCKGQTDVFNVLFSCYAAKLERTCEKSFHI